MSAYRPGNGFPFPFPFPFPFRFDGLAPNPRFRKGDVLEDILVQVVAHHEHVEVLVEGVHL